MGRIFHRLRKGERGQALVEMALVLPLLLLLLFGIIEFGRVGHAYLTLNYAAREGARLGITGVNDDLIWNRVENAAGTLHTSEIEFDLAPSYGERASGDEFVVHLEYDLELYIPFSDVVLSNPLTLQGRSVMRME